MTVADTAAVGQRVLVRARALLLGAAVAGSALGFVGARGWTIYLAVLISVGLGLWGLFFGLVFVPAVIAGVVARPDARP